MSETVTVTPDQLGLILMGVRSAAPIAFSALTDARARKTGNPYGVLRKLSTVQAFTGAAYEAAVRRQADREGNDPTFEVKERKWGRRISPALVVNEQTGDLYLVAHILKAKRPTYLYQRTAGFWSPVAKERIQQWLPADRTAEVAEAQGVERAVCYRNYRLDSLCTMTLNGVRYRIRRPAAPAGSAPVTTP